MTLLKIVEAFEEELLSVGEALEMSGCRTLLDLYQAVMAPAGEGKAPSD